MRDRAQTFRQKWRDNFPAKNQIGSAHSTLKTLNTENENDETNYPIRIVNWRNQFIVASLQRPTEPTMDDWSQDLTPEPARLPPPKQAELHESDMWDGEQGSLPSLPDPITDTWPAPDDDNTFSSEPSLGNRVYATLQGSVPRSIVSQHLRNRNHHNPLGQLDPNVPHKTRARKPHPDSGMTSVPREIKLEHTLEQLRRELKEARAKISELNLVSQNVDAEALSKLHKAIEVLSASNTRLTEEKESLQLKLEEELSRCKNLETAVKDSREEYAKTKQELQSCQAELEHVTTQLIETQTAFELVNGKCQKLEQRLTEHSSYDTQAMRAMRKSNQELHSRAQSLEAENKDLYKQAELQMAALESKCKECLNLTEEKAILLRRVDKNPSSKVQTDFVQTKEVEVQTSFSEKDVTSVSERLASVREATERTNLLRQHQQETSRLIEDHEQSLRDLEQRHSQRLQEVEEQAAEELANKLLQLRRSLTAAHQNRLDEMEKRHRQELTKTREDRDRKVAIATDSLEAALAQVTASAEQLEQDSQARLALEHRLDTLIRDHALDRQTLLEQHQRDMEKFRVCAEEKRASLLDEIQRGCNEVFSGSRCPTDTSPSTTNAPSGLEIGDVKARHGEPRLSALSPRSEGTTSTMFSQPQADETKEEVSKPRKCHSTFQASSSLSLSQSLAETEAIVLKVLGGNSL